MNHPPLAWKEAAYPRDAITVGVWFYLQRRYPSQAEAKEHRDWLADIIRRLAKARDVAAIHEALLDAIRAYQQHVEQQHYRVAVRTFEKNVAAARRHVERAIDSLRRIPGPDFAETSALLAIRDALAGAPDSRPVRRSRPGRPSEHVAILHAGLKRLHVPAEDRKAISEALGFTTASPRSRRSRVR